MARDIYFASSPLGIEFEEELCAACFETFVKMGDEGSFKSVGGSKIDLEAGTDAFIYGVPVDFTYNFSGKDHTTELPVSFDTDEATIRFGVRTGNSHKGYTKFKTPVLVIGVDAEDSFIRMFMTRLVESFKRNLLEIIDVAQDGYWEFCDANGLA